MPLMCSRPIVVRPPRNDMIITSSGSENEILGKKTKQNRQNARRDYLEDIDTANEKQMNRSSAVLTKKKLKNSRT